MGTQENEQVALLSDYDTDSAYAIAYQTLYNNIRFSWDNKQSPQHTIMLAAPVAYPGQATTAANVAIAAAQNGVPTILVDADLHTPNLQQRFGIQQASGLLDLLSNETITVESIATHMSETFAPGLRLLCTGASIALSASKTSQLLSARLADILACLRDFLAQTEKKPALIIFNSPPVLAGSDASLISTLVDQTFLVITAAHTTRTQARQAQEQLQRARCSITGIIMLDV